MTDFPIVTLYRLDTASNVIAYNQQMVRQKQQPLDFDAMLHLIRTLPKDDARKLLGAYMEATDSDSVLGWLDIETL